MLVVSNATLAGFAVALGVGLLVGAERERRKGEGPGRAAFGVRSFAAVTLLGAVAASLEGVAPFAFGGFAVIALAVAGYLRSSRDDPGLTTEIAWCLCYLLGVVAMSDPRLAAALGALLTLLLVSRPWLHAFLRNRLSEAEALDAILLAATALIALPLLPARAIDPWGALSPQMVGRITVIVLLVNAVGHVALRLLGARIGLALAGLFGGFVSSTATIASMGHRARATAGQQLAAVAGAAMSSVATPFLLMAVLGVTHPPLMTRLLPGLIAAGVTSASYALIFVRKAAHAGPGVNPDQLGRVFELRYAVSVASLMAGAVLLGAWLTERFGGAGAVFGITATGLADVHAAAALAGALARAGTLGTDPAVLAILCAAAANTAAKCVAAWIAGGGAFLLRLAPGLVLALIALVVGSRFGQ